MMSTLQRTGVNVVTVENSSWHNAALDDEGRVWTWADSNISYRMGRTASGTSSAPNYYGRGAQVTTTVDGGALPFILQISGSVENTLALDRDGNVWSWGIASSYALGRDGDRAFPGKVNLPTGIKAKWIAAGYYGGRIIDTDGSIWVWGDGTNYGLGTGTTASVSAPTKLTIDSTNAANGLADVKFKMISSSDFWDYSASIALTEDGDIYTWGNDGVANYGGSTRPKNIGNFSDKKIKKIDVGNGVFGFLTESGDVYTWGDDIKHVGGRQGHNDSEPRSLPAIIETVKTAVGGAIVPAPKFKDWSIYAWSMCAVDVNGIIYGCGEDLNDKHANLGSEIILTGYLPKGLPADTKIFVVSEGYAQTSYVDVYGNAYCTGPAASQGNNSDDGSIPGPWVHFTGTGKPLFTSLTSDPTSEAKRYNVMPRTTLNIELDSAATEIKYVIIYPNDTDTYTDGETFYSKTFAEFEQPYYNKGTNPQLLLSPNYDLWTSRYYANPKISQEVFDAAYAMKAASDKGTMDAVTGSGSKSFTKANAVSDNCIVWVQSMNGYGTTRMVYRFDNYYTQTKAWSEGIRESNPDLHLYMPELVGGGYGLPLDMDGNLIPGVPPFGYDIVKPTPQPLTYWILEPPDQLAEALQEDGLMHRTDPAKEIFLTDLSQMGDDTTKTPRVTFTYEKNTAMWADATLFFVDENGEYIEVVDATVPEIITDFAPIGVPHIEGQDPYIPPLAVDPNNKVIGYSLGSIPNGTAESYWPCTFPDGFKPVFTGDATIYIVYTAGMVSVTESFIDISNGGETPIRNNSGQFNVISNLKQGTEDYDQPGPAINGYVIVGHELTVGTGTPNRIPYPWSTDHYGAVNAFVGASDLTADTTVKFLYKADTNGNKIPDDEEGSALVTWYAVNAAGNRYRITEKTLYGNAKEDESVTINEGKETILPPADYDPDQWIFRPGLPGDAAPYQPEGSNSGTEKIDFEVGVPKTVYFYYDEDHNANSIIDNSEGYFTEKYKLSSGDDLNPAQADITSKWLGGETYEKKAPLILNYAAVGYIIEADGNVADETERVAREETGNVTVTYEIPLAGTKENYTITFLYAQDADNNNIPDDEQGSVTVTWVGTTFAGNTVEITKLIIDGYIDDDVTGKIYPPVPIDDVWKLKESDVPNPVILSATPQEYSYQYDEVLNFSTIVVESASTDGSLNFSYQLVKKLTDAAFDITAFAIPTYRVTGYNLYDNYDNAAGTGMGDTVSVDPADGSQRVVFVYESIITTVVIGAVDANDYATVLQSLTITDAVIGQKYSATAPYVDDTWVLMGEVLQVIDIAAGTNFINFEYEKATGNVTVLLKENDAEGPIIQVLSETVTSGNPQEIAIPDLTGSYYTAISTAAVDYVGTEPLPLTIEYYYSKDMMDVTVRAVDALDNSELKTESYPEAARKGESYTAFALSVAWYTLTEPNSKSVYADPEAADNTIIVDFTYKADEIGDITVNYFYNDEDEVLLKTYAVKNAVGDKFTAMAEDFPGFSLISGSAATVEIVVSADSSENIISFEYTDERKTVDVFTQIGSDETTKQKISAEMYVSGSQTTINPPYMKDHLVVGYIIDAEEMAPVDPSSFTGLPLSGANAITGDMSIVFVYATIEEIVGGNYIDVTIKGVTGEITHYSYVKRIAESALPLTLKAPGDAFDLQGYVLDETVDFIVTASTKEKIFDYYPLATTVTIRMADGTDTDVADSFAVSATAGAPFTYNAPNVPDYYLAGNALGKVDSVLANGESEIIFTYEEITSNVTIVAKENDTNGRVIGVFQIASPAEDTAAYSVPDLTADFYTALAPTVEITYDGTNNVSVEAYYTKDTISVEITAIDYLSSTDLGAQAPLTDQRKGEAVTVSAPNVTGYILVGNSTQIVIADGINQAVFKYRSLENDEVAVKALDPDGNILQSYVLNGNVGETISAEPPTILGWKTSDAAKSAQIGTDSEIIFNYTKNAVIITIKTVDFEGPQLDSFDLEAAKGDSYTAYAPHIPGYVVYGSASYTLQNLVADETVTFVYKTITSAVVTITVIGKCADVELYRDSILRANNSGNYVVTARDEEEYNLVSTSTSPVTVDVKEANVTVIFDYESIYTTVTIRMTDEDTNEIISIFIATAETGEPFTYNAPKIVGYNLTSDPLGSVPEVQPNGASEIVFTYKKIASEG